MEPLKDRMAEFGEVQLVPAHVGDLEPLILAIDRHDFAGNPA